MALPLWRPLLRLGLAWAPIFLFGAGIGLTLTGLGIGPYSHEPSPYSSGVRAGQMFLPALILSSLGVVYLKGRPLPEWVRRLPIHERTDISLTALLTGIVVLALPFLLNGLAWIGEWMHMRFVLSDPLIRSGHLVSWVAMCLLCMAAFQKLGHLLAGETSKEWAGRFLAFAAPGLGIGVVPAIVLGIKSGLLMYAASLPFFIITLIVANSVAWKIPAPRTA